MLTIMICQCRITADEDRQRRRDLWKDWAKKQEDTK
jgi:hypothetical protein